MWVRKRPDIDWRDLATGMWRCCLAGDAAEAQQRVEAFWSESGDALACLSVRSGFDLLLGALELPAASEVLMSALTIGDMPRIVRERGLVPVPVDLDPQTMAPTPESLGRAITPAARAVVVAHLFGGRVPMEPILDVARRHGLAVIEDCAQAFDGRYRGHPQSDASMFSFGPIKTATALGGALVRVRDRRLLERMRAAQEAYPRQSSRGFLTRLLKYSALKALCWPPLFGGFVRACGLARRDVDGLLNRTARGFPGPDLARQIRRRPSTPLLALLERRLRTYHGARLDLRTAKGQRLAQLLDGAMPCPGQQSVGHTHWVFPILTDQPRRVIELLRGEGFDATQGQSMVVVPPPPDRPQLFPTAAAEALARIVYLPFYPDMPDHAIERMAQALKREHANGADAPSAPAQPACCQTHLRSAEE